MAASSCCSSLSPCCRNSKCSSCCSKTAKLPRKNSTSVLSPNHFEAASKMGRSSCCSGPKEPVEYLHFSGDQLDDVFANPSSKKKSSCCKKKSSCCKKKSSCCSSGVQSPKRRSSCCSSGRQTPKSRSLCRPSSCCSSGGQTSPELSGQLSNQSISPASKGTCRKLCSKSSTSLPKSHSHGGHSPSCRTASPLLATSLKTPIQGQAHSSKCRRKGSVYFSQPGASPNPPKPLTSSPKSPFNGQQQSRNPPAQRYSMILPLRTALEAQGVSLPCEAANCQKPCCKLLPSSQPPKHFHLYRPVSWPTEIPAASILTKSESPGASPTNSPRDDQPLSKPPSRSASPSSDSIFDAPPIPSNSEDAWTSTTSLTPTLAPDPEHRKSIVKLSPSRSAVASTSVSSRTPDPEQPKSILKPCASQYAGPSTMVTSSIPVSEQRKSILQPSTSKSADHASTSIASRTPTQQAPVFHKSQSIQICSPSLILNTSRASTLSQSSTLSSQGNSPSRSTSSCFFFARSPKRSRPSRTTLEPAGPVLNGSTSTSSPFPRLCPTHGLKGSRSRSNPIVPTMSPYYGRLPSRPQIDSMESPHYHQSASLSYSGAQTRPRTDLLEIPALAATSPSDLGSPTILHESEPPSRPTSSWFRKPSCAKTTSLPKPEAQHAGQGRARNFWTRLWNKSTSLSSGCRLQDLGSLLTPILSAPKGPANPQYIKDERWIECSDARAFFIFGVNVVIVIVLTYFVDLLHDGRQNAEALRAADHCQNRGQNSVYCTHQHPPSQYDRGYPVYNVDIIK